MNQEKNHQSTDNMSMEVAELMLEKIFKLRSLKENLLSNKRQEVSKVTYQFNKKIDVVEKDIYKFENAIKKVIGAKEYVRIKSIYRDDLIKQKELEKQKPLEETPKDLNSNYDLKKDNVDIVDDKMGV